MDVLHANGGVPAVLRAIEDKLDDHITVTGHTLKENIAAQPLVENDVIFPRSKPKNKEGGIAILKGNLAPDGAVVKASGVKPNMHVFTGKPGCSTAWKIPSRHRAGEIQPGTVIVLRYEGPKGGPGMREMFLVTALLVGRGMDESTALVTDGRFSGSTGAMHRSRFSGSRCRRSHRPDPGWDVIHIDIPNRSLTMDVSDAELAERKKHFKPVVKATSPMLKNMQLWYLLLTKGPSFR